MYHSSAVQHVLMIMPLLVFVQLQYATHVCKSILKTVFARTDAAARHRTPPHATATQRPSTPLTCRVHHTTTTTYTHLHLPTPLLGRACTGCVCAVAPSTPRYTRCTI